MSRGRRNKLVGQAGEYLVAGEIARRGFIATTFTGNVPDYDIVCSSGEGQHLSVQVKTAVSGSWHLNISRFCDIHFVGSRQIVGDLRPAPVKDIVFVFVVLVGQGSDRFYVVEWDDLCNIVVADYSKWLGGHGWIRPVNPKSLHCQLKESMLSGFENSWKTIERLLGGSSY